MVLLDIVIFILAMAVLLFSSKKVIDACIKISEYSGISHLAIGFIVIAIAVSLPDFMVSFIATLNNKPALAIGDALGSSIANICLVLGIVTMIRHVSVERKHTLESAELLLLISLVPAIILSRGIVGAFEGTILLIIFVLYAFFTIKERFDLHIKDGVTKKEWHHSAGILFAGLLLVIASSHFVVLTASNIARFLGIPEAVIGLTLVSFGTTLPELVIDFTAIRFGHYALAIGDILGSTVVNLTLILGMTLTLSPTMVDLSVYTIPLAFVIIANSYLFYSLVKHEGIGYRQGVIFILMYVSFIFAMILTKGLYAA
ncbi:MAG: sodium:calcium antiporter [archaeon]